MAISHSEERRNIQFHLVDGRLFGGGGGGDVVGNCILSLITRWRLFAAFQWENLDPLGMQRSPEQLYISEHAPPLDSICQQERGQAQHKGIRHCLKMEVSVDTGHLLCFTKYAGLLFSPSDPSLCNYNQSLRREVSHSTSHTWTLDAEGKSLQFDYLLSFFQ